VSGATLAWSRLRMHARWTAIIVFGAGAGLLVGARMAPFEEEPLALIMCAASLLVYGHWLNIRCCRHAPCEACEPRERSRMSDASPSIEPGHPSDGLHLPLIG
jgi:hypothetical protein